jgi:outer membrane receptor for ferrienterochelin and colicin
MIGQANTFRVKLILWLTLLTLTQGISQNLPENLDSLYGMSLEELLNIQITVASNKQLTPRESPGVVSVITQTDIQNAGARDLIDVLRLVPGFTPVYDVQGATGFGVRGLFGYEGKISFMIDGIEINELSYGTTPFGNRIDVAQINRIEIIRGPGSSIYGGFAELGVINIITKKGGDLNGFQGVATYGINKEMYARRNVSLSYGKKIKDVEFSVGLFHGQAQRSIDTFTDIFGTTADLKDNSEIRQLLANVSFRYKDLTVRNIFEDYTLYTAPWTYYTTLKARDTRFKTNTTELKYAYQVNNSITVTPVFSFRENIPWWTKYDPNDPSSQAEVRIRRTTGDVSMNYDISEKLNLIVGAGFFLDKAVNKVDDFSYWSSPNDQVKYQTYSGYAQLLAKLPVSVTLGARFQHHSQYGDAFAPRLGLTKVFGKFHAKALVSQAFRVPAIMNIQINPNMIPERTRVAEMELGYQFTENMLAHINFFNIDIQDPIVYYIDENGSFAQKNFPQTGSQGIELEYRVLGKWGSVSMNYSYYSLAGKNEAPLYAVPGKDNVSLGMPQHKIALQSSFKVTNDFRINPTINYFSRRYGLISDNDGGNYHFGSYKPNTLVNLIFTYQNLLKEKTRYKFCCV